MTYHSIGDIITPTLGSLVPRPLFPFLFVATTNKNGKKRSGDETTHLVGVTSNLKGLARDKSNSVIIMLQLFSHLNPTIK